ncbi:amino acid permease [Terricaulis sp.]|uniref:amino acid permease n=1 Tax=Terricaulis sp. TaxID=2768686 RepID=UPI002AC5A533|nr:amino acid permease [Terricaulis sp.]MDZ4691963.1 amino acid permease [Terricaulis sp.]
MNFLTRRKPIELPAHAELKRTLSWPHLVALGVGAIVGAGIYALIGQGAGMAGPGVIVSFGVAGLVCACAALCYAELATMMPASGSAYTYTYSSIGELAGWIVGWALILEYSVVVSAVAVGWSGYASGLLTGWGLDVPQMIQFGEVAGHALHFNPLAVFIIFVVAGLLILGTRESAWINSILVVAKIAALILFLAIALPAFDISRFTPFAPFGWGSTPTETGTNIGVMAGAAVMFFAFYGFDAVSTAAEETKNPGRDLAIGIIGSMVICTLLYMAVGAAAIGAMDFRDFAASGEPIALIVRNLNQPEAAAIIGGVASIAIPTVILAFLYGQTRIFYVMSRDGLLPRSWGRVHSKLGTPIFITLLTAFVTSVLAGLLTLGEIASLANAGTLAAFIAVAISLMVLRRREPGRERPFRTPFAWVVAPLAIVGCLYLFASLNTGTIQRFFIWMAIGIPVYLLWGAHQSALAKKG